METTANAAQLFRTDSICTKMLSQVMRSRGAPVPLWPQCAMSPTIASGSNRGVAGNRYLKDRLGAIISETARANLSYEVNRVLHPPHPRPPRRGSRHVVRFRSMAALAVGADPSVEGAGGSPRCQACIQYRRAFGHGLQYRAVPVRALSFRPIPFPSAASSLCRLTRCASLRASRCALAAHT